MNRLFTALSARLSQLMRAMLATLGANVVFTALGIITGMIIARSLGPQGRGELSAVLAAPTLLSWAAGLGIEKANIYVLSKRPAQGPALFANSLWFSLLISLPMVIFAQAVAPYWMRGYRPEIVWACRWYLFTIPPAILSTFVNHLVQGTRQFKLYNVTRLITPVTNVVILIGLVLTHRLSVEAALVSQAVALLATLIAMMIGLRQHLALSLRPNFPLFWETLRYGIKVHLGTLASLANVRTDQVIMVPLVPAAELGLYAVAARLSEVLWQVSAAVGVVLFPVAAARTQTEARQLVRRLTAGSALVLVSLAVILYGLAPWLLVFFFGPDFASATTALRVLVIASVLNGLADIMSNGLRGMGMPATATFGDMLALLALPLLFIILPRYGIVGAAWVSVLGYGLDFLTLSLLFARASHRPAPAAAVH